MEIICTTSLTSGGQHSAFADGGGGRGADCCNYKWQFGNVTSLNVRQVRLHLPLLSVVMVVVVVLFHLVLSLLAENDEWFISFQILNVGEVELPRPSISQFAPFSILCKCFIYLWLFIPTHSSDWLVLWTYCTLFTATKLVPKIMPTVLHVHFQPY